ncbi:MAG: heavy-metal-associated domain-containing protein [Desulfofustis sp.]|nr:heavy-metal-associated domain-containing protein [Desulfofustis sp.]
MTTIRIKGMSCQHCVASVTKALQELPGVSEVKVDLEKGEATYKGTAPTEAIAQAVKTIGFEVI